MIRKLRNFLFLAMIVGFFAACSPLKANVQTTIVPTRTSESNIQVGSTSALSTATPTIPEMTVNPSLALSSQYQITLQDNGRTFTYTVTSRFLLYLDKTRYLKNEQVCQPEGIASWVSNAMGLYDENLKLDSVGFETVKPGICVIQVSNFQIIIQVVD
jgi:hypothetical protein